MGEWSKVSTKWVTEPDHTDLRLDPFQDRGEKLIRGWLERAWGPGGDTYVQIGIGFELDPDNSAHRGAMLSVGFDDGKPVYLRPHEVKYVAAFLRDFYDRSDDKFTKGEYREDLDGFLEALEGSLIEAANFGKDARRH